MSEKPIRVLIVDNSLFFRQFMARSLSADYSINVVGMASTAQEAQKKISILSPNILCLDIETPNLQYKDYIRDLRQTHPDMQIVIISPLSTSVFEALKAGAVDFVSKPNAQMQMDNAGFISEVIAKIKTVYASSKTSAAFRPSTQPAAKPPAIPHQAVSPSAAIPPPSAPAAAASPPTPAGKASSPILAGFPLGDHVIINDRGGKRMIAIGASTGGTEAIVSVVKNLPSNTPGVVIVQHMPPVFTRMYAERLDKICNMRAKEAEHGDRVQTGLILLAPGDKQMRLAKDVRGYYVTVGGTEKISGHCPSVDCLFESVATTAGANAIGVILTGMGGDGAKNLLKMREAGAYTIGQDETTCVVYGMPMVAYNLGAVQDQLPLTLIPNAILRYLSK